MATVESELLTEESEGYVDGGHLMTIGGAEIDAQISTAKKYPRSIRTFLREAMEMVTLSEEIAGECIYSLPRGGKPIEGPSARFAEIVASAWGNCRAGARVVGEDERFVTSQGVFIDLQRNVAITYESKRRITDKNNVKYKDDMIGVTSNAACSIALRNAVLKGVPKAFWKELYDAARKTAIGDVSTLSKRRADMLGAYQKMGVQPAQIFAKLAVAGEQDITLDHLALLRGMYTALKDGDTTVEQLFSEEDAPSGKVKKSPLADKNAGEKKADKKTPEPGGPSAEEEDRIRAAERAESGLFNA